MLGIMLLCSSKDIFDYYLIEFSVADFIFQGPQNYSSNHICESKRDMMRINIIKHFRSSRMALISDISLEMQHCFYFIIFTEQGARFNSLYLSFPNMKALTSQVNVGILKATKYLYIIINCEIREITTLWSMESGSALRQIWTRTIYFLLSIFFELFRPTII